MYDQAQPQYGQPGGNGGEPHQGEEEEDVVERLNAGLDRKLTLIPSATGG
jgi:hypothetical protein